MNNPIMNEQIVLVVDDSNITRNLIEHVFNIIISADSISVFLVNPILSSNPSMFSESCS